LINFIRENLVWIRC